MTAPRGVPQYHAMHYRRLRAPSHHGEFLIDPPLEQAAELWARNLILLQSWQYDCQGRPLQTLREEARTALVQSAASYTAQYQQVSADTLEGPILMAGHQPELYHTGVWAKSFLLDRLARRFKALAVNLLIDNDTLHNPAIQVPGGSVAEPYATLVPFDAPTVEIPFEERRLEDSRYFTSFADRVQRVLRPLVPNPLLRSLWPCALDAARRSQNLGRCLAEARHRVEMEWGLRTLELPLSMVCDTAPFRWFACHLLAHLPRFRQIYNDALREYRQVNRVRSRTHPAPALATEGEWLEAPFWIWTEAEPQRRRLFIRRAERAIELTDRHQQRHRLPLVTDGSAAAAVETLEKLAIQGVKLRPRALVTTMYARLFLCELFVHGIGGAKYDQLTDALIERFFAFAAPAFLTATATAKLPIARERVDASQLRALDQRLRDLRFNPQRYVAVSPENEPLVAEKNRWIQMAPAGASLRSRHQRLGELNATLSPWVAEQRLELLRERERLVQRLRAERVLNSREYSFCLFPEQTLRTFLLDI